MFNIYSILFGISFNHKFNIIGDLYLSQILIIITSLFFFIKKKNYLITDKIIQKIMILGFLWLLAAIISDYINSSSFRNYSRGLSKIIVTILSFMFLQFT
jgi:hypothetical protein